MFPTYTLTEDYAFGMELKKKRFHARYVREYLAVGEAPHQVRNCFQQRSRWTKVSPSPSACRQPGVSLLQSLSMEMIVPRQRCMSLVGRQVCFWPAMPAQCNLRQKRL